jgi:hypothetical protein
MTLVMIINELPEEILDGDIRLHRTMSADALAPASPASGGHVIHHPKSMGHFVSKLPFVGIGYDV